MAKKRTTVPVSLRALIQRINRKLPEYEFLKTTRGTRDWLGDHYVLDTYNNSVTATHVDPETLGRDLGVLKEWEGVVA